MIDTPYDLDAVRALDDDRLAQLLELIDTFGARVASAWLTRWQNGRIDATNEKPPGGNRGATVCLSTGQRHDQSGVAIPISHASGLNARGMSMTNPSIARIQAACCAHYGVGIADLCSERQGRTIAPPRHVAMWLCKRLTRHSVAMIGQKFGYRDHSSVYHAIRLIEGRIASGKCPEIWALLAELQRPHATAWPQIEVAHGWVAAAISTRRAA